MVVSLPAGTMRHRVELYQATTSTNALGELVETFPGTATDTIWAGIAWGAGDETDQAGKTEAVRRGKLTMRHYSTLTEKDRFKFDSRWYRITSIDNVDEMNVKHVVDCVEVA